MMLHISQRSLRGFTLVELLVSMAIFVTVITVAVGALFSAQSVNARLEQTKNVLDGVHLATEIIVRDIRYGSNFYCDTVIPSMPTLRKGCAYPNGGTVLVFKPTLALNGTTDQAQDRVAYYISNGVIYKNEYPYGGSMRTHQVTSSDVNVERLSFYGIGLHTTTGTADTSGASDFEQPLITMVISGVTIPKSVNIEPVSFSVHTSAASRTLDR